MHSYKEVITSDDMAELVDSIGGFHDSMIKEMRIANRAFVGPDRRMMMGHRYDAQVLVQSQWARFARELVFIEMTELGMGEAGEYSTGGGSVEQILHPVEHRQIKMLFDEQFEITAARLFFRDRPNWLGQRTRLRGEVPSPDAVSACRIEADWRQCSACSDAWQEWAEIEYSYCPTCSRLTWVGEVVQGKG